MRDNSERERELNDVTFGLLRVIASNWEDCPKAVQAAARPWLGWIPTDGPVFTFDWPHLREGILIKDDKGKVWDRDELALKNEADRPAISTTFMRIKGIPEELL